MWTLLGWTRCSDRARPVGTSADLVREVNDQVADQDGRSEGRPPGQSGQGEVLQRLVPHGEEPGFHLHGSLPSRVHSQSDPDEHQERTLVRDELGDEGQAEPSHTHGCATQLAEESRLACACSDMLPGLAELEQQEHGDDAGEESPLVLAGELLDLDQGDVPQPLNALNERFFQGHATLQVDVDS
jgi:hypothetical protein